MRITGIFFRPPLAIARLGGADTPMDSYVWREDPTVHGAARNVIEPAVSFEVLGDGSLSPFVPSVVRFRDRGRLRPVAPFLELWAQIEHGVQDAGSDAPAPGTEAEVPLTGDLLTQVGAELSDVVYGVRVANRKAARRTGDESNGFSAGVQVQGDDVTPRPLLASSPPQPGGTPLVLPEHPVSLGCFQVIRPVAGQVGPVDLDVLRVRFTPAQGEVYGPPSAVVGLDDQTGRAYEIVPPGNRVLNPAASWVRYTGTDTDPQPSDTYDGADQGDNQSWGVVDDTCDGIITATLVVHGQRFSAQARICVGPPDYAPDRRPFVSWPTTSPTATSTRRVLPSSSRPRRIPSGGWLTCSSGYGRPPAWSTSTRSGRAHWATTVVSPRLPPPTSRTPTTPACDPRTPPSRTPRSRH
jgi:hypothetical protein